MTSEPITIPARSGAAVSVARGACVQIITPHGQQVVDTWAFRAGDMDEFMSMEHSRSCLEKLMPAVGDSMFTNRRRPILTVVEDTSPGIHDTLLSACDAERYRLLGHDGYHDNCVDNLRTALAGLGLETPVLPSPWNVFETVTIAGGNRLHINPPVAKPGDHLTVRMEMDAVVVFSACPMDLVATNGADRTPKEARYRILPAG